MARSQAAALLLVFLACSSLLVSGQPGPIKHVVTLMLENRAFDHMMGFLTKEIPGLRGLQGTESNPINPFDPNSQKVTVNPNSGYVNADPGHAVGDTTIQVFGGANMTDYSVPPPMNGFVAQSLSAIGKVGPSTVMSCFNKDTVPVITTLAKNYAVFDMWFASVPGPTDPNRLFLHAGTSAGLAWNNWQAEQKGLSPKTIYDSLAADGYTWATYYEQISYIWSFSSTRQPQFAGNFRKYKNFFDEAKAGTLPNYAFIEPRYYPDDDNGIPANDQHPDHNIALGEQFIKDVYEALRSGPLWNETMMIVLYDEHGGFYDHMPTPVKNVPNPDGLTSDNPPFKFDRLGVRIPTIAISPWIDPQVIHEPVGPTADSQYDHTSIAATLKKMWNLKTPFLTKRDAWAGTFEAIVNRTTPRTDCPMTLPTPPVEWFDAQRDLPDHLLPVNGLQASLLNMVQSITGQVPPKFENQGQAGRYVTKMMDRALELLKEGKL